MSHERVSWPRTQRCVLLCRRADASAGSNRPKLHDSVRVAHGKGSGTVKFAGVVPDMSKGSSVFYGVELESTNGNCDGTYAGVCFFRCRPQSYALCVLLHMVTP